MINKQKTIGVFGAKGFVGSEISKYLKYLRYDVIDITRETFENDMFKEYDYVINAACSSERWKAKSAPYYDFEESVEKTAQIFYEAKYKKFIQISSLSARCQTNTIYGRNRLAAESIVNDGNSLIVRLGSMYGPTLMKGPLIDMINPPSAGLGTIMDSNLTTSFTSELFVLLHTSNLLNIKVSCLKHLFHHCAYINTRPLSLNVKSASRV